MAEIKYVGSTYLSLDKLEKNHREARSKDYSMTLFRTRLEECYSSTKKGNFRWLVVPALRTEKQILELEKKLINKHLPEYNQEYDPVGRKDGQFDRKKKYRGVYCFEV